MPLGLVFRVWGVFGCVFEACWTSKAPCGVKGMKLPAQLGCAAEAWDCARSARAEASV